MKKSKWCTSYPTKSELRSPIATSDTHCTKKPTKGSHVTRKSPKLLCPIRFSCTAYAAFLTLKTPRVAFLHLLIALVRSRGPRNGSYLQPRIANSLLHQVSFRRRLRGALCTCPLPLKWPSSGTMCAHIAHAHSRTSCVMLSHAGTHAVLCVKCLSRPIY